jgi:hypothetical protein
MSDFPDHLTTTADEAAALVLRYAPLVRRSLRLPAYAKPQVRWDIRPACDPAFAADVRAIWDRLDLRDPHQFSEGEALVLRYHRMHGLGKLSRLGRSVVDRHAPAEVQAGQLREMAVSLGGLLAQKLLDLMAPAARTQWFPYHCFDVRPGHTAHDWTLMVDSLVRQATPDGQVYYHSRHKPTAMFQGVRLPVGFTPHAIERLQARRVVVPESHASLHDVFSYTNYCQYFAPAQVHPDQPAVAMFDSCLPGYVHAHYAAQILGLEALSQRSVYRLGYCPVVRAGDVWLAKTFLMPGYIGTPEYSVLWRTSLDAAVKARMLEACEELTFSRIAQLGDVSLLRWFHQHGVPQVIPEPANLFVYE